MMQETSFKGQWGDIAYRVYRERTQSPYEISEEVVAVVGRKYVTLDEPWHRRFDIETGYERTNYGVNSRLFPTRDLADEFVHREKIYDKLLETICGWTGMEKLRKWTTERLDRLIAIVEEETNV